MYILLKDAKQHLNVDEDFHEDDKYILELIEVAENAVFTHIDKDPEECMRFGTILPSVRHAILLLLGSFYANREAVSFASASEIPFAYQYLIDLNKYYKFP